MFLKVTKRGSLSSESGRLFNTLGTATLRSVITVGLRRQILTLSFVREIHLFTYLL